MKHFAVVLLACLITLTALANQAPGRYLDRDEFLQSAFVLGQAEQGMLWVTPELREAIEAVLEHRFALLRVRYWYDGSTTAWIIDEIGKEEPITIGVTIDEQGVEMVRILEFRESRGWEVRYPFFTDQFNGAKLDPGRSIDRHIDGITGATLSVGAVSRVVKMALIFHEETGVGGSRIIASASTS